MIKFNSILYLIFAQIFQLIENFAICLIIKNKSAVFFEILQALRIPVISISTYFLMKNKIISYTQSEYHKIHIIDIISLVLILVGTLLYAYKKEIKHIKYEIIRDEI